MFVVGGLPCSTGYDADNDVLLISLLPIDGLFDNDRSVSEPVVVVVVKLCCTRPVNIYLLDNYWKSLCPID